MPEPTRAWVRLLMIVLAGVAVCGCNRSGPGNGTPERIFGQTGLGPGDFSYPRTIAVGPDGDVFVIDKSARVQRFNSDGEFEHGWQMPDWRAGKPVGVTIDRTGRVFIADTHYHRVKIYDYDGNPLGEFGSVGTGPGQFTYPTSVAIDREGFIYVAEYGGLDRISKFTSDFGYVMEFGTPDAGDAALLRPQSLEFDAEDTLWLADSGHHRICRFSREGVLLSAFGTIGSDPGQLRYPYGVRVAPDGNLLVAEYGNNRVQMFTPTGTSLWTWGSPGRQPGQLAIPWALAIGRDGRVYVVDSGNNRIQVFRL